MLFAQAVRLCVWLALARYVRLTTILLFCPWVLHDCLQYYNVDNNLAGVRGAAGRLHDWSFPTLHAGVDLCTAALYQLHEKMRHFYSCTCIQIKFWKVEVTCHSVAIYRHSLHSWLTMSHTPLHSAAVQTQDDSCYHRKPVYASLHSDLTVYLSACDSCCPSANQHITQAWLLHPRRGVYYRDNILWVRMHAETWADVTSFPFTLYMHLHC